MNYKVYCHISPSNKIYIGITQQGVNKRWQNGKGYKGNQYFYRAIQKYGWDNFQHEILFENLTKQEAEKKEIELIKKYDSTNINKGYNILEGGNATSGLKGELNGMYGVHRYGKENPNYGKKHSAESREKISKNHANMKGGNNPNAQAGKTINKGPESISRAIKRKGKSGGYHWEYVLEKG